MMILQTIKTLTKYKRAPKFIYNILFVYNSVKCINYYMKNMKTIDVTKALRELCYGCSYYNITEVEINDIKFKYKIVDSTKNIIDIDIVYKDIKLKISINSGVFTFSFTNDIYFHNGRYDFFANLFDNTNKNIQYDIYGTLLATFYEVLNHIFTLTPKYDHIL